MDVREVTRVAPSEPHGVMVMSNSSYGGNLPNTSVSSPHSSGVIQTVQIPVTLGLPAISKPVDTSNLMYQGDVLSGTRPFTMSDPMRKKRGRPRKYGPDGNMALTLTRIASFSGSAGLSNTQPSEPAPKKPMGRPPGSRKKLQLDALGSAWTAFTPHIITVKAGEDVLSKIMAFSQQGSHTVCILSANGAISNVTLRQPATSGGTVSYEGRFEIISLSGSFLLTDSGGTRSRTGGLSVSLAGSDGRVLGGGVAGMLMAASPVQVVVGSFISDGKTPKPESVIREPSLTPSQMAGMGHAATVSPPSQGTSSESSEPGSPIHHIPMTINNPVQPVLYMSSYAPVGWTGSHSSNQQQA